MWNRLTTLSSLILPTPYLFTPPPAPKPLIPPPPQGPLSPQRPPPIFPSISPRPLFPSKSPRLIYPLKSPKPSPPNAHRPVLESPKTPIPSNAPMPLPQDHPLFSTLFSYSYGRLPLFASHLPPPPPAVRE